jgi:putative membrane protein
VVVAAISPAGLLAAAGSLVWWLIIGAGIVWRHVSTQYGFTVATSPDGIRIRRGLLGTVAETIPVQRVQAVRMVEPLLWRPLHWCRLEVDVAGHPGRDKAEGTHAVRKALLPVGGLEEAGRLVRIALPGAPPAPSSYPPPQSSFTTRPPRRARWKAPLSYHFLAAGHDGTLAVAVTGRVNRQTTWVPLAKAQSVRLVQGPLQRMLGLATVHLDAAGRRVRAEFRERRQEEARALVTELAALSRTARKMAVHATPLVSARPAAPAEMPATGDGDQAASVAPPVNASQREA